MKKALLLGVLALVGTFGLVAQATTTSSTATSTPRARLEELHKKAQDAIRGTNRDVREIRKDVREDNAEDRDGLKDKVHSLKVDRRLEIHGLQRRIHGIATSSATSTPSMILQLRRAIQDKKIEFHRNAQDLRQAVHEDIQERREDRNEKVKKEREELRKKMEGIRDERKKLLVQNIAARLDALNDRMIENLEERLNHLEDVALKIDSRADQMATDGHNVSRARTALGAAEDLIDDARALLTTQASKTYPIKISDEEHVRENVQAAREALHTDISKIREKAKDAHRALGDAAFALKNATSTSSGN